MKTKTKQQIWEKRKEMIEFLKHILPYWESDDLDDYMYIVHHYDLERVATKFQEVIEKTLQEQREEIVEEIQREFDKIPQDFCNDSYYSDKDMVNCLSGVVKENYKRTQNIINKLSD